MKARLVASGYHLLRTNSMVSKTSHVPPYWNHSCDIRSLRRIGSKWRHLFVSPWFGAAMTPLFVLTIVESTLVAILTKNLQACRAMSNAFLERAKGQPTGFANHLPPPLSNQPRCPPKVVVQSTVYGLYLISSSGSASLTAICCTLDGICIWGTVDSHRIVFRIQREKWCPNS